VIQSIYGTPITAEANGEDVYLDINGMHDVLLTPETALQLAARLVTVAMILSVAASDTEVGK
jgi:hypothetical protein